MRKWQFARGISYNPWLYRATCDATHETEHFITPAELSTFLSARGATPSQIATVLADLENHEKNWQATLDLPSVLEPSS